MILCANTSSSSGHVAAISLKQLNSNSEFTLFTLNLAFKAKTETRESEEKVLYIWEITDKPIYTYIYLPVYN